MALALLLSCLQCVAHPLFRSGLDDSEEDHSIALPVAMAALASVGGTSNQGPSTPRFSTPDTGASQCYDGGASTSCGSSTFPSQDADFSGLPATRSYVGPLASPMYPSDHTTLDEATGLVWKTCSEGSSGADCSSGAATNLEGDGAQSACLALNSANGGSGYAGRTDWRLPTVEELLSLRHYGKNAPRIDETFFPATVAADYWSSTVDAFDGARNWAVDFNGFLTPQDLRTGSIQSPKYVRCVAGEYSRPAYVDNGDGTVTDSTNGLVWQKCGYGQNNDATCSGSLLVVPWQSALQYCDGLTLAGREWRLPSVNELMILGHRSNVGPAIQSSLFPSTAGTDYWTSTTQFGFPEAAFRINFFDAAIGPNSKSSTHHVRCVASVQ